MVKLSMLGACGGSSAVAVKSFAGSASAYGHVTLITLRLFNVFWQLNYTGAGKRPYLFCFCEVTFMSILYELDNESSWWCFLESKREQGHLTSYQEKQYIKFINEKKYLPVVENIKNHLSFPLPNVTVLNKKHSNKKRTVF